MAYAVRQRIRGKVYVYVAENIYRPKLRQSRQVRRYVGTLDDEDRLVIGKNVETPDAETRRLLRAAGIKYDSKRKRTRRRCRCGTLLVEGMCPLCSGAVSNVERIGARHLFGELSSALQLDACLRDAFGERWRRIYALAVHRTATGRASYLSAPWLAGNGFPDGISSGSVSRLLRDVGADAAARERFLTLWRDALGGCDELLCDVTSVSTHSNKLKLAEWGYNRDRESLPQLNVVLACERGERGLPVAYRLLPGSVPDVSTLANTSAYLSSLGFEESAFRLDKGFYSRANLLRMHREGRRFVIGVPFSVAAARKLFSQTLNSLKSTRRSFLWSGRVMRHAAKEMTLRDKHGSERFRAHLYFEPARAADMRAEFERRMLAIEVESVEAELGSRSEAREWLAERARKNADLFKIAPRGMLHAVERKPNSVARAMKFMGCSLLLTNERGLDKEGALSAYRSRDSVEKLFDALKNETGQCRIRTGDDVVAEGQIFLSMISLILRKALESRMRQGAVLKKFSIDEVVAEIEKISTVKLPDGGTILAETTKKQRDLLRKLDLPQPQIK